jgi:hypothetical protein
VKHGEAALARATFSPMSKWATGSGAFYSPDGTTLVFARLRGPQGHLHVDRA